MIVKHSYLHTFLFAWVLGFIFAVRIHIKGSLCYICSAY